MPKYFEEKEVEDKKKKGACYGLKVDLKECLLNTDCVKVDGKTPRECLQTAELPECQSLRVALFECKRSLLDMRTRFRGRKGY